MNLDEMKIWAPMRIDKSLVCIEEEGCQHPRPSLFVNHVLAATIIRQIPDTYAIDVTSFAKELFPATVFLAWGDALGFMSLENLHFWLNEDFPLRYGTAVPPWDVCPFNQKPPFPCVGCDRKCWEKMQKTKIIL